MVAVLPPYWKTTARTENETGAGVEPTPVNLAAAAVCHIFSVAILLLLVMPLPICRQIGTSHTAAVFFAVRLAALRLAHSAAIS